MSVNYYVNGKGRKKGRYSRGRGKRGGRSTTYATAVMNPFSGLYTAPKVPDGKCTMSAGLRQQQNISITLTAGLDVLAICPHPIAPLFAKANMAENYGNWEVLANVADTDPAYVARRTFATPLDYTQLEMFRIVSQGTRIMCTSNAVTNDGWWEAIRVKLNDIGANATSGVNLQSFIDHPTYSTGKIRDLSQYIFQNKPLGDVLQFNENFTYSADVNAQTDTSEHQPNILDSNYDTIVIKFHGSANVNVVAHVVQNIEVIFRETNNLKRFMTVSNSNPRLVERTLAKLTSDIRAARKTIM